MKSLQLMTIAVVVAIAAPALAQPVAGGGSGLSAAPPPAFAPLPGRSRCAGGSGYGSDELARTFLWRPEALALARAQAASDPSFAATLRRRADAALQRAPDPVTLKRAAPSGGTLNDYYSIGPYWWPAPGKRGGLPYERRDGKTNPEARSDAFDRTRLDRFSNDIASLALAWHLWGDRRYAEKAAVLLRVWLIDPATRMNPHMNFAQAVPGRSAGRAEGLIDARVMGRVVEAIGLIDTAQVLGEGEQEALEGWFTDFVNWMATSTIGRTERAKGNNHGFFYDATLMHFALFARLDRVVDHIAKEWPAKRLAIQLAADGSLPQELSRTRSLHYSFFTLEAAAHTATLAECVGIDLWRTRTHDGRDLQAAFSYVAPYAKDPMRWRHPEQALRNAEAMPNLTRQMARPLMLAAWGTGDRRYAELAAQTGADRDIMELVTLPSVPDESGK